MLSCFVTTEQWMSWLQWQINLEMIDRICLFRSILHNNPLACGSPTSVQPVISFVFITCSTIPCNCLLELHLSSTSDKSIVCTFCALLIIEIKSHYSHQYSLTLNGCAHADPWAFLCEHCWCHSRLAGSSPWVRSPCQHPVLSSAHPAAFVPVICWRHLITLDLMEQTPRDKLCPFTDNMPRISAERSQPGKLDTPLYHPHIPEICWSHCASVSFSILLVISILILLHSFSSLSSMSCHSGQKPNTRIKTAAAACRQGQGLAETKWEHDPWFLFRQKMILVSTGHLTLIDTVYICWWPDWFNRCVQIQILVLRKVLFLLPRLSSRQGAGEFLPQTPIISACSASCAQEHAFSENSRTLTGPMTGKHPNRLWNKTFLSRSTERCWFSKTQRHVGNCLFHIWCSLLGTKNGETERNATGRLDLTCFLHHCENTSLS